eukprot:9477449-Pyramimonas_sp.AAC.1
MPAVPSQSGYGIRVHSVRPQARATPSSGTPNEAEKRKGDTQPSKDELNVTHRPRDCRARVAEASDMKNAEPGWLRGMPNPLKS